MTTTKPYDYLNRVSSISASSPVSYSYDGKLRRRVRWESTLVGSAWVTNQTVRYVYDGNLVIQERDGHNLALVSYTRGNDLSGAMQGAGGIGGLLGRTDSQSSSLYHCDGNGNVTCLIGTNQLVVARYLYDPYGNTLSASGPLADANLYRFSSKESHANSGLVYYLYRFYDPNLQRWPNRDPLGELGGVDLYTYVENNPVAKIDPTGKLSVWPCTSGEWSKCFKKCQKNGPDFICVQCIAFYQEVGIPPWIGGVIRVTLCVCYKVQCTQRS